MNIMRMVIYMLFVIIERIKKMDFIKVIIYLEDKMYVYYISYYDNGNINKEVLYINSKKNGIYKEYDYNGDIVEMFEYKDDVLIHDYEIEYV
jgi:antitoxin component YwqK of YwqJK toxin-antitoxin module